MALAAEGPLSWRDLHINFVSKSRYAFRERDLFGHGHRRRTIIFVMILAALFDSALMPASDLVSSDAALPLICSRASES